MLGLPLLVWRAPIVTIADLEIHFICLRQLSNLYADSLIPMLQSHSQGRWHRGCWRSFWSLFLPQFWWSHLTGWMHLSRAGSHTYPWKYYFNPFFEEWFQLVHEVDVVRMCQLVAPDCHLRRALLQMNHITIKKFLYKFKMKNIKTNLNQNSKLKILPAPTIGLHFSLRGQI